jgi:hypothetical protein
MQAGVSLSSPLTITPRHEDVVKEKRMIIVTLFHFAYARLYCGCAMLCYASLTAGVSTSNRTEQDASTAPTITP